MGASNVLVSIIPIAKSSDLSDHAVPQDASVWAQVNIFADWYKMLCQPATNIDQP